MKIQFKNYTAEADSGRFNLSKTITMTAKTDTKTRKKGEKYKGEVLIGYGYSFESLLHRIATDITSEGDIKTISQYINEYKETLKQILDGQIYS